jgi:hypothetical protein
VSTACDSAHFELAKDLLTSLRAIKDRTFSVGFVQLGKLGAPSEITSLADEVRLASEANTLNKGEGFAVAQLAIKARLPEFFPNYDTYVWMDSDVWVQNSVGVTHIINCAHFSDICVHPQLDPNYWRCRFPDAYTANVYDRLFGPEVRRQFAQFPMINAGVFGAGAGSPLWSLWADSLFKLWERHHGEKDQFFSDQIPLHRLVFSGALKLYPLRAVDNWLVLHSTPGLNLKSGRLTAPSVPYEEINIVHLVGAAKWQQFSFGDIRLSLRYRDMVERFGPSIRPDRQSVS